MHVPASWRGTGRKAASCLGQSQNARPSPGSP
jgi:hypothetical protein